MIIMFHVTDSNVKAESSVVSNLLFRGRIALDNLDIENIEDGTKDYHSHGVTVHHGWKVGTPVEKTCLCYASTKCNELIIVAGSQPH